MNNQTVLKNAAFYSTNRTNSSKISIENFVTIDNILQNKSGIKPSEIEPNGNLIAFEEGDILIGNIRPYLKKIWFADKKGGCSPDVLVIKAKQGFDSRFVYYSLFRDDFFNHMMKGSKGTKMPRGDKNQILDFHIPDFDFPTQQKIASVLSALDSKIELNNRINAELEAMAKTLYGYWFVQFDFPDAHGKPYKSSGGKMQYNAELKREIPDGWEVGTLKEILDIFDSKRIPLSNMQRAEMKGKYPYYGATSIMDYIDDYIFDGEYILLAEDGSVMDENGFPIVQYIWGKTWVNNHAHVLKPKKESNYEYLFHLLKSISVIQIMTGSIQKKINQDNLMNVKIPFPNSELLTLFSKFATPIRKQIINTIEENQKLAELRDWLLPMLMNGQVTVN